MRHSGSLLLEALREPAILVTADAARWELILALSRRHGLAGRWHGLLAELGALNDIDADIVDQLSADARIAERRVQTLKWEVTCATRALAHLEIPVVLLKGAAYVALGLPSAGARMTADLDILVPHHALQSVEAACTEHGWRNVADRPYDDAYFRTWMHELPPMQHVGRGTMLDIHHNILPLTSRLCPDADMLLASAVERVDTGLRTLQPVDVLLHSMVHGFFDGEFLNGLRDTLDVHEIATYFAANTDDFWPKLTTRARDLGFARPAAQALAAATRYFGLVVPAAVTECAMPVRTHRSIRFLSGHSIRHSCRRRVFHEANAWRCDYCRYVHTCIRCRR